jgi:hypothetical protein
MNNVEVNAAGETSSTGGCSAMPLSSSSTSGVSGSSLATLSVP